MAPAWRLLYISRRAIPDFLTSTFRSSLAGSTLLETSFPTMVEVLKGISAVVPYGLAVRITSWEGSFEAEVVVHVLLPWKKMTRAQPQEMQSWRASARRNKNQEMWGKLLIQ